MLSDGIPACSDPEEHPTPCTRHGNPHRYLTLREPGRLEVFPTGSLHMQAVDEFRDVVAKVPPVLINAVILGSHLLKRGAGNYFGQAAGIVKGVKRVVLASQKQARSVHASQFFEARKWHGRRDCLI